MVAVAAVREFVDMTPSRPHVYEVPPPPEESLAEFLDSMLRARGWTQDYLADLMKINQGQISLLIRGRVKVPGPERLLALDTVFGLVPGSFEERTTGKRGAALRTKRAPPPAGSIVILPSDTLMHEICAELADMTDEQLAQMLETARFVKKETDPDQKAQTEPA